VDKHLDHFKQRQLFIEEEKEITENKKQKKKPKIILGGKEIEHDFTYEEVEDIGQSIRSIQFSAIK
jgi:hypothetical protein